MAKHDDIRPVEIVYRETRPTGQPPRCAVCGWICSATICGVPRCEEHARMRAQQIGAAMARAERDAAKRERRGA